jgi:hypothetical protein
MNNKPQSNRQGDRERLEIPRKLLPRMILQGRGLGRFTRLRAKRMMLSPPLP